MYKYPNNEYTKACILEIIEELRKDSANDEDWLEALDDLQNAVNMSMLAFNQHCFFWIGHFFQDESNRRYQGCIEQVNERLDEELGKL